MKLTILSTSDIHGYIYPTDFENTKYDAPFSLSRAASIINQERKKSDGPVVTCDLGDFLQGSPLTTYLFNHNDSQILQAFQDINYDFGLLGNHEFNYGQKFLKRVIKQANYPFLCANITNQNNDYVYGNPYKIMCFDNLKVAFVGITTAYIPHWEDPQHITGLKFKSAIESLRKLMPILDKKADIIIVCYHGGFEDINTNINLENEGYELLHNFKKINALLTGHQHRIIATHLNHVPVTQPGYRGAYIGKIVLDIRQHKDGSYYVNSSQASVIPTAEATPSRLVLDKIAEKQQATEKWLDKPVGTITSNTKFNDSFKARSQGCAYITLINQIQMDVMQTDISATSLFNDFAHGFNEKVTMRDILMNYIYSNTLVAEKITGKDLYEALEKSASYFTVKNGKLSVNPNFDFNFNYDMYTGINYVIDVNKPIGQRIVQLRYHNHDVQYNEQLTIALNQYRGVGGGDYPMFSTNKIIRTNHNNVTNIIANYLQNHPRLRINYTKNFKVIY